MDCFRSGLEFVEGPNGLDAALDGRPGMLAGALPKKSRPSNESPGLLTLPGGGTAALFTDFELGISAVLGLIGGAGVSSPNRSRLGTARRGGCGC